MERRGHPKAPNRPVWPKMNTPAISVVIPSYNGAERLPRTLASLVGSRVEGGFEVLVVDDGSSDGTSEAARAFADRLPISIQRHPQNRGRAAARNTAIRSARGGVVLILDDDMESSPGLIERHLAAHRADPRSAAIGRIVQEGLDPKTPFHAFLMREEESRRRRLLETPAPAFGEVWTGQFSADRQVAEGAGLFDEGIRAYGLEDIEFAYRLSRRGVRFVYLDDAVTRHAAFTDSLDRYCARHASVGAVAAYLARRHDTPEMRRYLRIERQPRARTSTFRRLMDASGALLRRPRAAAFLAGPVARPVLRAGVRALEAARLDRPLSFVYSFLRDIQYFNALGRALLTERGRRS